MTTIIQNPRTDGRGPSYAIAILIVIALLIILIVYGLPNILKNPSPEPTAREGSLNIEVTLPQNTSPSPTP